MPERDRPRILDIEKSLGFKWERGLSRKTSLSRGVPVVKAFLIDFEQMKKEFVDYNATELRASHDFEGRCEELFQRHGQRLWPSLYEDTSSWLVNAEENNWGGLYPRNLTYQNLAHREELQRKFQDLLAEKCIRYHWNHWEKLRRSGTGFGTQEEDSGSDLDHIDEPSRFDDDFSEGDSIYVFPPKRPRSHGARRVKPSSRMKMSADTQPAFRSVNHFVAPVAQMVSNSGAGSPSSTSTGIHAGIPNNSMRPVLSEGSFDVDQEHYEQLHNQIPSQVAVFTPSSPDSVPYRPPSKADRSPAIAGHKHVRPMDSDDEDTSEKLKRSSSGRIPGHQCLVKLKIDPARLASIRRQPAPSANAYRRTARKMPVLHGTQLRDDLDSSEAEGNVISTLHWSVKSRNGFEDPQTTNYTAPDVLTAEDEDLSNHATSGAAHTAAAALSILEPGPRVSGGVGAAAVRFSVDQSPEMSFQPSGAQSPSHLEYPFQPIGDEISDDAQMRIDPVNEFDSDDRAYNNSNPVRKVEVIDLVSDITSENGEDGDFVFADASTSELPFIQSDIEVPSTEVDHVHSARKEGDAQLSAAAPFSQRSGTMVSQGTGFPPSPTSPNDLNAIPNQSGRKLSLETIPARETTNQQTDPNVQEYLPDFEGGIPEPIETTPVFQKHHAMPLSSNFLSCAKDSKVESDTKVDAKSEAYTALERAKTVVYWDANTDCPNVIGLRCCQTHQDFFNELFRRRPQKFETKAIKAVEVRLTNAEDSGIADSPNCTILADNDQAGLDYLVDTLSECTASVRPKLKLTVQFEN